MSGIGYKPLNRKKREIRLIVLEDLAKDERGEFQPEQPLRCKFVKSSLALYSTRFENRRLASSNAISTFIRKLNRVQKLSQQIISSTPTPYIALSYVWGDPVRSCEIEIDGQVAKIPRNLAEALRSIQANTDSRIVWVDALCINQDDDYEKSWQVQEMESIYRRAPTVVSWLGPGTPQSNIAFKELEDLSRKEGCTETSSFNTLQTTANSSAAFDEHMEHLLGDTERWTSVLEILDRPYWTRIWIFQELASAGNRLFLCGNLQLPNVDRTLHRMIQWIEGESRHNLVAAERAPMIVTVHKFEFQTWKRGPEKNHPTLLELLRSVGMLRASDGRDMVFALISIAEDGQELGIVPDYSKSIETIFTETAIALLQHGRLEVLLDAIRLSQRPGLPSWIPDWQTDAPLALKMYPELYRVCGPNMKPQSTVRSFPLPNLTLECYIVDRVLRVGNPYRSSSGASDMRTFQFSSWLRSTEIAIWDHSEYVCSDITDVEERKALSEGITVRLLSADSLFVRPFLSRIPRNFSKRSVSEIYQALQKAGSLALLQQALSSRNLADAKTYVEAMKRLHLRECGARPFRTVKRYSGLSAYEDCEVGDSIIIVPGISIPLIIRKAKAGDISEANPARLVGMAYIHGIMDGELFEKKDRQKQTVVLC